MYSCAPGKTEVIAVSLALFFPFSVPFRFCSEPGPIPKAGFVKLMGRSSPLELTPFRLEPNAYFSPLAKTLTI